jgi:hypothetical protein
MKPMVGSKPICMACTMRAAAHALEANVEDPSNMYWMVLWCSVRDLLYRLDLAGIPDEWTAGLQKSFEVHLRDTHRYCSHLDKDVDNSVDETPF